MHNVYQMISVQLALFVRINQTCIPSKTRGTLICHLMGSCGCELPFFYQFAPRFRGGGRREGSNRIYMPTPHKSVQLKKVLGLRNAGKLFVPVCVMTGRPSVCRPCVYSSRSRVVLVKRGKLLQSHAFFQ